MDPATDALLAQIDAVTLTPPVRRALGREDLQLVDWQRRPLLGGLGAIANLYRFSGQARAGAQLLPWAVVLKLIRRPQDESDPNAAGRWSREALAYQSELFSRLPDGLQAPRLLGYFEQPGQLVGLWLEEIEDEFGPQWPLERYQLAARQLGLFNAAYLGRPLPDWPWLSRRWLRAWVAQRALVFPELVERVRSGRTIRRLPPPLDQSLLQLIAHADALLVAIEQQPQTLCHLDAFRRNLFSRRGPDGQVCTVLIDWAFVGHAALGEELAPLVAASAGFLELPYTELPELDRRAFASYLEGLRDGGWSGDPAAVRFSYAAASALRYGLLIDSVLQLQTLDERERRRVEERFQRPYDQLVENAWGVFCFLLELADEARSLYPAVVAAERLST